MRLAGAHRDPEKEPLLRELTERYPPGVGSPSPATPVLEGGTPLLLSYVGDEEVRARAPSTITTPS